MTSYDLSDPFVFYNILLSSKYFSQSVLLKMLKKLDHPPHFFEKGMQAQALIYLSVSFSPADETGHSAAISAIERCIQVIRDWMHDNKLLLNEAKTEFLLIGTKQQLAKVNISHVEVGNANIAPHSPVKNLGVWFDSNLSMVDHITKTSSAAFYHLYNIRRIRNLST